MIRHAVTPISMKEEDTNKKLGRFCMTFGLFPAMPGSDRANMVIPSDVPTDTPSDSDSEPKLYTPPIITPK